MLNRRNRRDVSARFPRFESDIRRFVAVVLRTFAFVSFPRSDRSASSGETLVTSIKTEWLRTNDGVG
ncbi:hypothetical protein A4G99_21790 [Haladaptatus sp. R4]|nr:hypothetical protein A4G99_21790 [Haladaptatus sp. R4]